MKKIIAGITAGIALLSVVGTVQATSLCADSDGSGLAANCPLLNESTNDPAISGKWIFSVPSGLDAGTEVWTGAAYADEYYYQAIDTAPNFASMLLSTPYMNDFTGISIQVWNGSVWSLGTALTALNFGDAGYYDFGSAGVRAFHLSGIDSSIAAAAGESLFLTGVTFKDTTSEGGTLVQTPKNNNSVPEPGTVLLLASGLLGFGLRKKQ